MILKKKFQTIQDSNKPMAPVFDDTTMRGAKRDEFRKLFESETNTQTTREYTPTGAPKVLGTLAKPIQKEADSLSTTKQLVSKYWILSPNTNIPPNTNINNTTIINTDAPNIFSTPLQVVDSSDNQKKNLDGLLDQLLEGTSQYDRPGFDKQKGI